MVIPASQFISMFKILRLFSRVEVFQLLFGYPLPVRIKLHGENQGGITDSKDMAIPFLVPNYRTAASTLGSSLGYWKLFEYPNANLLFEYACSSLIRGFCFCAFLIKQVRFRICIAMRSYLKKKPLINS